AGSGEDRLMAGAADLEKDQVLVLELDLLVVDPAREDHRAIGVEQVLPGEAVIGGLPFRACAASTDGGSFHARRVPFDWERPVSDKRQLYRRLAIIASARPGPLPKDDTVTTHTVRLHRW